MRTHVIVPLCCGIELGSDGRSQDVLKLATVAMECVEAQQDVAFGVYGGVNPARENIRRAITDALLELAMERNIAPFVFHGSNDLWRGLHDEVRHALDAVERNDASVTFVTLAQQLHDLRAVCSSILGYAMYRAWCIESRLNFAFPHPANGRTVRVRSGNPFRDGH